MFIRNGLEYLMWHPCSHSQYCTEYYSTYSTCLTDTPTLIISDTVVLILCRKCIIYFFWSKSVCYSHNYSWAFILSGHKPSWVLLKWLLKSLIFLIQSPNWNLPVWCRETDYAKCMHCHDSSCINKWNPDSKLKQSSLISKLVLNTWRHTCYLGGQGY